MPKVGQSDLTGVGSMQETGVAAAHARQKSQMGKKLWNHGAGRCGYGSWSLISQDIDVLFISGSGIGPLWSAILVSGLVHYTRPNIPRFIKSLDFQLSSHT